MVRTETRATNHPIQWLLARTRNPPFHLRQHDSLEHIHSKDLSSQQTSPAPLRYRVHISNGNEQLH